MIFVVHPCMGQGDDEFAQTIRDGVKSGRIMYSEPIGFTEAFSADAGRTRANHGVPPLFGQTRESTRRKNEG